MISRLSRKFKNTHALDKYLEAGLQASNSSRDKKLQESHDLLLAEQFLQIRGDTAEAVRIKKTSMGGGWKNNRDKFYAYAKWCLERKINLEEAETFTRRAIDLVYPGIYRARVLNTLAEICSARGKRTEAIQVTRLAIEQQPENPFYAKQLKLLEEDVID